MSPGLKRYIVDRLLGLLSILLIAVGCSDSETDSAPIAQIDTVGSRIEVTNTGRPLWTAETRWRLEEDLRLGTAAAADWDREEFGDIQSVGSDSRGRIYVLEGMTQEIRLFDSTGVYLHTIGRRGRGPGEFSGASELDLGPGDTLMVLDDGLMRFSVFASDGTFVGNHRRDIVGTGAPVRSTLQDGSYLDWAPAFPDGRFGARVLFYPVRYEPGFERADTFPPVEYRQSMVPSGRRPLMDDNAGHILVFADVAGQAPGTVLDVFRESGEYLGRARLPTPVPLSPNRPPIVHVSPEYLYIVVEDEMEVPYVSRLAVADG